MLKVPWLSLSSVSATLGWIVLLLFVSHLELLFRIFYQHPRHNATQRHNLARYCKCNIKNPKRFSYQRNVASQSQINVTSYLYRCVSFLPRNNTDYSCSCSSNAWILCTLWLWSPWSAVKNCMSYRLISSDSPPPIIGVCWCRVLPKHTHHDALYLWSMTMMFWCSINLDLGALSFCIQVLHLSMLKVASQ